MSAPDFEWLRKELLRNGVSPRHVCRTILELADHFDDLEAEARRHGYDATTATVVARDRLGQMQQLAAAVAAHDELKSWIYRYPHLARIALPVAWVALLPVAPLFAGAAHAMTIVRWCACLLLSAVITAAMMLFMQLTITLS